LLSYRSEAKIPRAEGDSGLGYLVVKLLFIQKS